MKPLVIQYANVQFNLSIECDYFCLSCDGANIDRVMNQMT